MSDVNPCISEDIWFEIFKNLPVKTLGKCRCVCKSWRSLIVSPSFMAAHLKHYTLNDANSVILYKEIVKTSNFSHDFEQISLFRDLDMLKQGNTFHSSTCPFLVPQTFTPFFHFVGSVNGLLCLSDCCRPCSRSRILIWNPLILNSIKLPNSTFTGNYSVLGFGYDYLRNDHRVVKISNSDADKPLVEVYSVQERTWRTICAKYFVDNPIINNISPSNCFRNGVIHWLLLKKAGLSSSLGECLLLFNVAEERFTKMELPQEIIKSGSGHFGIFQYQEYLGANEVLIGIYKETTGQLESYDPKTRQFSEHGLHVSESTKLCAFSESLALLDQNIDDLTADELERSDNRRRRTCRDFLEYLFGDTDEVDRYMKKFKNC